MQFGVIRFRVERAAAGYELIYRKGDVETRLFESMNSKGRNADHKFANLLDRARGLYIVPRGEPIKGLDIALREHDVFRDLANTEPTPNGALSFTHKWGLLRSGGELSVHEFLKTRTKMEWSLDETGATLTRGKSNYYFGSLCIAKEKGNIVFRACELSQFCWLERFQALEGKVDFSRCRNCTTFLPIDKLGRPQLYCSDRCKQAFYRKGKRDAV